MLVALELEFTLALENLTNGLRPDMGPYTLATLYATASTTTLKSGQPLKPGVQSYVAANDILPEMITEICNRCYSQGWWHPGHRP